MCSISSTDPCQRQPELPAQGQSVGLVASVEQGLPHAARIDLYNGAGFTPQEIQTLRTLNPNILITRSINTVERDTSSQAGVPDAYWLHDTTGKKIEVWPGAWRLNLTKPEVAAMQAQYAYQQLSTPISRSTAASSTISSPVSPGSSRTSTATRFGRRQR